MQNLRKGYGIPINYFMGANFHCLKAAFLCFVSSGLVTTFKLLYKKSTDTVDRPLINAPMLQQG